MSFFKKQKENFVLSNSGIDEISGLITETLTNAKAERKNVVQLRLTAENVLLLWKENMPDNSACSFTSIECFGRTTVTIAVPGPKLNPAEICKDDEDKQLYMALRSYNGVLPAYDYVDGENRLILTPNKSTNTHSITALLLTIPAALLAGFLCRFMPANVSDILKQLSNAFISTFMGVLSALAGPLVFLSVCVGIVSIGDTSALNRIGKTTFLRFISRVLISTIIAAACFFWLFSATGANAGGSANPVIQILNILLNIIPSNIVAPFSSGNSLQIIFMAVCLGIVLLALNDKVTLIKDTVTQANLIVQTMMKVVGNFIVVLVFVSLFSIMLTQEATNFGKLAKGIGCSIGYLLVFPIIYVLITAKKLKVPFALIAKKTLPAYLRALTTASSTAALHTVMEEAEKRFGISRRLIYFAAPLGQICFKVGSAARFMIVSLCFAEAYGIAITLSWIIEIIICCALLSSASPPIAGGAAAIFAILFAQAGIPAEAVVIVVAIDIIVDFFSTGCNVGCLQLELALTADKLGMLDREILCGK